MSNTYTKKQDFIQRLRVLKSLSAALDYTLAAQSFGPWRRQTILGKAPMESQMNPPTCLSIERNSKTTSCYFLPKSSGSSEAQDFALSVCAQLNPVKVQCPLLSPASITHNHVGMRPVTLQLQLH
ncbi:hypothetical protein SKAU_G00167600 [Synaphobranchus kaupii]|uniref:Uncharacterized protein n=1 Tax=Synaphobranchus kaupii TaxID=118154 RepID=A0A9Q1FJR3_SYNKA|nr:hypothetical protein SKAU_G00167600 [Synaphobranchus kaupii]